VQKFCSTSCRVLFNRHQGSRADYELKKQQNLPTTIHPSALAKPIIQMFYMDYLGKSVPASLLIKNDLLKKIEGLNFSTLKTIEKEIISHIRRILESVGQIAQKNPPQSIKIRMKEKEVEQVEAYLKIQK
jgi:hypothetical protein